MKKLLLIPLCVLVIIAGGCIRDPQITRSASAENFSKYEKAIGEVSKKYNLSMNEIDDPNYSDKNDVSKDFKLTGTDMEISFYLSNDALDTEEKGEEVFLVAYDIPKNKDFDLDLFTDLVNSVSGKTITKEYCEDFIKNLNVTETKTPDSDRLFYESKSLDFFENWTISYELRDIDYPDAHPQVLKFDGLTKATE